MQPANLQCTAAHSLTIPLCCAAQVGNIYQRFTSPQDGSGKVENIIELGAPFFLEGKKGITITVEARYGVHSCLMDGTPVLCHVVQLYTLLMVHAILS